MCARYGLAWSDQAEDWLVASNGKVVEYAPFYFGYRPHFLKLKRGGNYSGIGKFSIRRYRTDFLLPFNASLKNYIPPKLNQRS